MDIGVGLWSMRSTADAPASIPVLYQELREDARLAEEWGFHSLWLSEHHFWYDGWCPSLLVAGAAALGSTTRLHVGTGVFLMPLHDPERIVADGLQLAQLAPGRFELGVGLGYREPELDALGISRTQRGRRADAALELIRSRWGEEAPRLWIGGIAERSLARAARYGLGLFLPSTMRDHQLREVIARGRAAATEAGMELGRVGVLKNAWLTDGSDGAARGGRAEVAAAAREYSGSWWSLRGSFGFEVPALLDEQMTRAAETALVGPPAYLIDEIRSLEDAGVDLVVLHVASDRTRPAYRAMMERISAEVLPGFA